MAMTMAEKVLARASSRTSVAPRRVPDGARGLDVRRQLDELLREILSVVHQPEKSSHFKTVQSA